MLRSATGRGCLSVAEYSNQLGGQVRLSRGPESGVSAPPRGTIRLNLFTACSCFFGSRCTSFFLPPHSLVTVPPRPFSRGVPLYTFVYKSRERNFNGRANALSSSQVEWCCEGVGAQDARETSSSCSLKTLPRLAPEVSNPWVAPPN